MVGEVRDLETAQIAIKASLTGHLVLSTLHTNDCPATVDRLINMGVETFLLTSSINLILAQRLVRKICDKCKEPINIKPEVLINLGVDTADIVLDLRHFTAAAVIIVVAPVTAADWRSTKLWLCTKPIKELILKGASAMEFNAKRSSLA